MAIEIGTEYDASNYFQGILDYEEGVLEDDEVIALFEYLISSGIVWQLQGSYGRFANYLIEQGLVEA